MSESEGYHLAMATSSSIASLDKEQKRRIDRLYDLTEPPLRKLLLKIDPEFQITDWQLYYPISQGIPAPSVSTIIYDLSLTRGEQNYVVCAAASSAPYDRGCGKLRLFLRADDGTDLEIHVEHTMPGDRSFEGRRSRWLARRLGMIAAVADRLTIDDDKLQEVRDQLDQVCSMFSERNLLHAADVEAQELAAVKVKPGKRQRPSALAARS
jgi:hypothetical protein